MLEKLQPRIFIFWSGEGAMNHDDTRRNLRLLGEEVIPAVKEMAKEMGLNSPFEVDPATNQPVMSAVANPA